MERQQLLGFVEVARRGSFSRAAQATGRTQPAVSQQVRALEDELGCALLERRPGRAVRLTRAGEKVLAHAQAVLGQEQRLRDELAVIKGRPSGRLGLAAPFTTLYQLLPAYLGRFARQNPGVEVTVLDRPQAEAVDLLRRGAVEVAVCLEREVPAGLEAVPWQRVVTGVLTPQGHELAGRRPVSLEQAARFPLILPPAGQRPGLRAMLEERLRLSGRAPRVVMETGNVELASRFVESGLGLCFASVVEGLPVFQGRALAFVPLAGAPRQSLALVTRPMRRQPAPVRALLDLLLAGPPQG